VSIDDFGTGYSSLQYLERLPVSVIKIDQSFVRSLPANRDTRIIVEAAVGLAHQLGMEVVAEGVETGEAYAFLRDLGCDLAQGYYISRALPSAEFSAWHRACDGLFKPG
jgi:EAL domain-containing protein (putative c-di-GMP-specific phosphodiesterase class I)